MASLSQYIERKVPELTRAILARLYRGIAAAGGNAKINENFRIQTPATLIPEGMDQFVLYKVVSDYQSSGGP